MDFGIFNLMGAREPGQTAAQVFADVTEQTRLADELGYGTAWFAEHHFSNYSVCASPLMMVAHCAPVTKRIRLGTAVVVLPLYNPARLLAEIATADSLSNGRLSLGVGSGYQPYEFERFGVELAQNMDVSEEFLDLIDRAFAQDFFSYQGRHYNFPKTHIAARPVQSPLPVWVAGHTEHLFRTAARRGYHPLSSGRTGGLETMREQRDTVDAAWRAEGIDPAQARLSIQRFCCITDSREEGMRFAENARYQTRLASGLRRREEVMQGTMLVDRPFPDEPSLEEIHDNLPIGDPDHVAERLAEEIRVTRPAHMCFNFAAGNFPARAALRSIERFKTEVLPKIERALGPAERIGVPA